MADRGQVDGKGTPQPAAGGGSTPAEPGSAAQAPAAPPAPPAPPAPRRGPGHRGTDVRDAMAELAAKAQEISQEAGSMMASTMRDVIHAAAGMASFTVESARDLVQYMVRRGQITQEQGERLLREAEEGSRKSGAASRPSNRPASPLPYSAPTSGAPTEPARQAPRPPAAAAPPSPVRATPPPPVPPAPAARASTPASRPAERTAGAAGAKAGAGKAGDAKQAASSRGAATKSGASRKPGGVKRPAGKAAAKSSARKAAGSPARKTAAKKAAGKSAKRPPVKRK